MKNEMPVSGGKSKLKNGDAQMPNQNSHENLYGMAGSGNGDSPSGDAARGYTGGEEIAPMGKDNFKIRQQNPNGGY